MILRSITPRNFGPFIGDTTLHHDPDVTVITGPNDAGKSLALRTVEILCSGAGASEHEINRDRIGNFSGKWNEDPEIWCEAQFEITASDLEHKRVPQNWTAGSLITVRREMNKVSHEATVISARHGNVGHGHPLRNFPKILSLPFETQISQVIDLGKMTEAEKDLVRLGFGREFNVDQYAAAEPVTRSFRLSEATIRLNNHLRRIFPPTMPLRFSLFDVGGESSSIAIGLVDGHEGFTPIGSRGTGVRRLLNVMGGLLRLDPSIENAIVLYDEPETSLHADAQHMLRRLLESLAATKTIQVIYATHSPAMINTLRPQSVRVLQRTRGNGQAVSQFVNNATEGNYSLVRSTLGISPADSLLYSPITLIVEGVTEARCIPLILKKLADAGSIDAATLSELLPDTHILDGEGASVEYMCRLAKSQNCRPVIFLDGDKPNELQKLNEKHPEVPLILLESGKEFEDLVPKANYIRAAAELLDNPFPTVASFSDWEKREKPKASMMFSKRVERWLYDTLEKSVSKPRLMQKAVELTDASGIVVEPFRKLLQAMKDVSALI